LPVCPTRPITSPTRTGCPVVTEASPEPGGANSAKASTPCMITWFPATRFTPLRAGSNLAVCFRGERDVAHQLDPRTLRHPVHGHHDFAGEGCVDGLAHP
jgi:hypothetical protein